MSPMNPGLMTIGMFSRATLLTVKALRNYHESGLLVPAEVDPTTGYRGYHAGQLADAVVIKELRALDLPLADIEQVMEARDPDVTSSIVSTHLATMEDRLATTKRIVDRLLAGTEAPGALTPPRLIDVPHLDVIVVRGTVTQAGYAAFLDEAFATLFSTLDARGQAPSGPGGATYPPTVDDEELVEAFVPIAEPFDGFDTTSVTLEELPSRLMATTTHHGSYDSVAETYMQLGRWVALNAQSAEEAVREHYIASPADTTNPADFVTDIQWPVLRTNAPQDQSRTQPISSLKATTP